MKDDRKNGERVALALRTLYRSYGYSQYRVSKFEEYDLYVRNKSFLPSERILTFTDVDGRLMALKPDVTLSIVRNSRDLSYGVQKVFYHENVYRSAGGSGNFRELTQVGLECIGEVDDYAVCEVLSLAEKSLGEISPKYLLDISHLGILSELINRAGVPEEARGELLGLIAEKNLHGIRALCEKCSIPADRAVWIAQIVSCSGKVTETVAMLSEMFSDDAWKEIVNGFCRVLRGLSEDRVRIDFSVINDMSYYNGIVFQGFVAGIPTDLLSGGQYDRLMEKMGRKSRAIGFAVYFDQLDLLAPASDEVDADTVVLYDEKTDPAEVLLAVQTGIQEGKRVIAARRIPEKLTYRNVISLGKESGK